MPQTPANEGLGASSRHDRLCQLVSRSTLTQKVMDEARKQAHPCRPSHCWGWLPLRDTGSHDVPDHRPNRTRSVPMACEWNTATRVGGLLIGECVRGSPEGHAGLNGKGRSFHPRWQRCGTSERKRLLANG